MAGTSSQSQHIERILRDRHAILRFNLESEEAKFQHLVRKNILETYHLQPSRMHNMKKWLEFGVPIQWRRVFAIDCVPYRELVLEFFSTFCIRSDNPDIQYPSIVFKLGGVMRAISLKEFALRLGIYTAEDIEQGLLGTWHPVTAQQLFQFWKGLVDYKDFRIMYIQDSRQRILHQLISAALFGYREIVGNLDHTDIRIMYSIMNCQYLCPALYIAKACVEKFSGKRDNYTICGGKIATKLAESYGLLTADFTSKLEPIGRVFILDIRTDRRLKKINEPDHKYWTLLHDASPVNTPTKEIHPEATHAETTESVVDRLVQIEVMESQAFHQGASSSGPTIPSFQELLELPEIPSFQTLLELSEIPSSQDFLEFSDIPMPELPPQLSLEEMLHEISPQQTFHLGQSSSQQGASTYHQDKPQSAPTVEVPPTFEDLVREVRQIKKDLADLTAWLKNRLS